MCYKLLLFDLDGTLLKSDKSISENTLNILKKCRNKGLLVGISTSRSEKNCYKFISELQPDIIISSGGALVRYENEYIFKAEFTSSETKNLIQTIRDICGFDCEITVDTINRHYWNYKIDPQRLDSSWGNSTYSDFLNFNESALKVCAEIFDKEKYIRLKEIFNYYDCIRFSDGYWHKFTKNTATKANVISKICDKLGISTKNIISFGDDYADIEMLKLCGKGVAMGNAIDEVKAVADVVIGTNDNDGIANYLFEILYKDIHFSGCKNTAE